MKKQSVPRANLEVRKARTISGQIGVAEYPEHIGVIAPPNLGREEAIHIPSHIGRVAVALLDRIGEFRQSVSTVPTKKDLFFEDDMREPAIIFANHIERRTGYACHQLCDLVRKRQVVLVDIRKATGEKALMLWKERQLHIEQTTEAAELLRHQFAHAASSRISIRPIPSTM